nr:hypothetical protein [Candidatus Enterousia merdequi]
ESAALLDMSRLNIYQQRNSDDILTCKKKILTQLSDASVCGENLYKCLDTTGEYINPSTGQAVLSENLYNLTALLQTPEDTQTWSSIDKNEKFVDFLNSKKAYLEPAIEQCQDIADTVWDEFLDDALAQIKLAQNSKLEEIRQSCTTLVSECKIKSLEDLSEFDARALSTFSVLSDKTANEMCSQIENSCIALMNNIDATENWEKGMSGISADITHDAIIESCTQIGRDCIIRQCNGISGNFALCTNANDAQRIAILSRKTCWGEVYDCVKNADKDNLNKIQSTYKEENAPTDKDYYYGTKCDSDKACLITKQIWGDCEYNPTKYDITSSKISNNLPDDSTPLKPQNKITSDSSTLLSWFATNTGTSDALDNCNAKGCLYDYWDEESNGKCTKVPDKCLNEGVTVYHDPNTTIPQCITNDNDIITTGDLKNYCAGGKKDFFGNCCAQGSMIINQTNTKICVPDPTDTDYQSVSELTCKSNNTPCVLSCPNGTNCPRIYCVSKNKNYTYTPEETYSTVNYYCNNGFWLLVDDAGNYSTKLDGNPQTPEVKMSYYDSYNKEKPATTGYDYEYIITYK